MRWLKFCQVKEYFDKGYNLTTYFKWLIAYFGLASGNLVLTMWIAGIYGISCFIIGYSWYRFGIINAELEILNRVNPFVKEMREMNNHRKV